MQALSPARRLWRFLLRLEASSAELHLGLISAGVAFYTLLSIFPAMTAVVALWSFFADPVLVAAELETYAPVLPAEAFAVLSDQVTALASAPKQTLGWATVLSLMLALWTARSGVEALMRGLTAVYRTEPRSGVMSVLMSLFFTMCLIVVTLVALLSVVVAPVAIAVLPLDAIDAPLLSVIRWGIGLAVVGGGLSFLYRYGPNMNGRQREAWLSLGAGLALALWGAASWGFSYYLSNFSAYNEIYGSLGAVIALMMWFYLSAYVVLLGGLLNAERAAIRTASGADPADNLSA